LLYKRTSKERRKGNPPTPTTLSLYTIRLPSSNQFLCSDVPSESHPMILHTIPSFLIVTTMPPLPTSQHLRPLLYLTKLRRHPLAASSASSNVSVFLEHNSFRYHQESPSIILSILVPICAVTHPTISLGVLIGCT
jgi:hypothetical protein